MVHPQVRGGYQQIAIFMSDKSERPDYDMFIGKFQSDGQYHVLGYHPLGRSDTFSAESESNGDHGVVELPNGKMNLRALVKGEAFTIRPAEGDSYDVRYGGHN